MPYFVYIVECSDKTLYTGTTSDIQKRIHAHNSAKSGAKYTKSRRPVTLRYSEEVENVSAALKREAQIKKLSRKEKLILMKTKNMPKENLDLLFIELKKILKKFAKGKIVGLDELLTTTVKEKRPTYVLYGKKEVSLFNKKPTQTYIMGIIEQKNFVGLYSLPLYYSPKDLPIKNADLKKILSGKSCFHVTYLNEKMKKEIEDHIKKGIKIFEKNGWI